jgi:uroporphyrinogen decarboxylase
VLRAARGQPVDTTPVWFLRQAGRYLPEYRRLRERYSLRELCRHPELAAEATLQPLARMDVDAVILFSDLLVPLWGMGLDFQLEEGRGPFLSPPPSAEELARLPELDLAAVEFVPQTVRLLRRVLDRPLVGFAGAPFTVAAYVVEGRASRDWPRTRSLLRARPDLWHALAGRLASNLALYLRAQVEAGAQLVHLFDSWVGVLSAEDFRWAVRPYLVQVLRAVEGVPRVYFATGCAHLLQEFRDLPVEVVGVDWRVSLPAVASAVGDKALQGNLDPAALLGDPQTLRAEARRIVEQGRRLKGHVFNLGHGVLPETDPGRLAALVDWVHEGGKRT